MNTIKLNSSYLVPDLHNQFNIFFDDFLMRNHFLTHQAYRASVAHIYEDEHAWHVEVSLAGFQKEDINLSLEDRHLKVSAERKSKYQEDSTESRSIHREFGGFTFKRTFKLPTRVDLENIKADYQNGVLHITLPKTKSQELAAREIPIS